MQIFNLYINFATTLEYGSPIAMCIYGRKMDDKHRLIDGEAMPFGEKSAEIVDESTKRESVDEWSKILFCSIAQLLNRSTETSQKTWIKCNCLGAPILGDK